MDESPLWHFQKLDPKATEKDLRNFLGGFDFQGDKVMESVRPFSGGEKARLVLALLVYQNPNLLLLDEPTNHLDLEMREALIMALQDYQGALVTVSHDRHLLRSVTDRLLLVADSKVELFDGDLDDYRPGTRAARELGIVSPMQDVKMTKQDIRVLSREMNLPTWDKPADTCLATRIPYGQKITPEKLLAVERAEQFLLHAGFRQVRVRHHGDTARIEVSSEERALFFEGGLMEKAYEEFTKLGFTYAALDLRGLSDGKHE
jgi:ABC-type multidrug transport system ATPase subunit